MTKSEELFNEIAASIPDAVKGKMFGALCIKAPNGKAGVMLYKGEDMIFKMDEAHEQEALALTGAKIFTPMEDRPMNGWVQLSPAHSSKWKKYAAVAMEYVSKIEVPKKTKKTKTK